jgi:hypothetical protein
VARRRRLKLRRLRLRRRRTTLMLNSMGGLVADSVGLVALFLVLSLLVASAILAALVDLASVI